MPKSVWICRKRRIKLHHFKMRWKSWTFDDWRREMAKTIFQHKNKICSTFELSAFLFGWIRYFATNANSNGNGHNSSKKPRFTAMRRYSNVHAPLFFHSSSLPISLISSRAFGCLNFRFARCDSFPICLAQTKHENLFSFLCIFRNWWVCVAEGVNELKARMQMNILILLWFIRDVIKKNNRFLSHYCSNKYNHLLCS